MDLIYSTQENGAFIVVVVFVVAFVKIEKPSISERLAYIESG